MKCKVCGAESGRYHLCRECNQKKEEGLIIKCSTCGNWHYRDEPCPETKDDADTRYVYNLKKCIISKSEHDYFFAIRQVLPRGYYVFPQINLGSFIEKNDHSNYRNELFRIVDFLITDLEYAPKVVVEINDRSHTESERQERDQKVKNICEEAGIPLIRLWTSYGVNHAYIEGKISEALNTPVKRVHHFTPSKPPTRKTEEVEETKPFGCYVATCVYGSYDCPQVWVLRRYRDNNLAKTWYGRLFIKFYYATSPHLVKWFGRTKWFRALFKSKLDSFVKKLSDRGYSDTPYQDPSYK